MKGAFVRQILQLIPLVVTFTDNKVGEVSILLRELMKLSNKEKEIIIDKGLEISLGVMLDGALGQIAPGLVAVKSSYKQLKSEKRIAIALQEMVKRQEQFELALSKLSHGDITYYENEIFSHVLDITEQETQKEKIKLIINGFETILENNILDEDKIFTYYDVLKELRLMEIRRLFQHTSKYLEFKRANAIKNFRIKLERDEAEVEKQHFENYIDNKLDKLGLIGGGVRVESEIRDYDGMVTPFGKRFLNFIKFEFAYLNDFN